MLKTLFSNKLKRFKILICFLLLLFFSFHGYLHRDEHGQFIRDIVARDGPLKGREVPIGYLWASEPGEGGGYLHDGFDRFRIVGPFPFEGGELASVDIRFNEEGEGELLSVHVHRWRLLKHLVSLVAMAALVALFFLEFRFDGRSLEFYLRG
jgi:hypothetical protein